MVPKLIINWFYFQQKSLRCLQLFTLRPGLDNIFTPDPAGEPRKNVRHKQICDYQDSRR